MSEEISGELRILIERFEQAPKSRIFAPLADAYRKNGDIDRAIELCENGLELYPDYASAHVILGKCFYDKGATERSRTEFQQVLEIDPENMVALKYVGEILLAEDKRREAADYFKRLLSIDPMNNEVSGILREIEAEFQGMEIDLNDEDKIKKVGRPKEMATMTLAGIYAAQGYYSKALKIYRDILRVEPGNKEAQQMIGKLQSIMDSSEKERKSTFDGDVMTISLDDVSMEMAKSTAGRGGEVGEELVDESDTGDAGPDLEEEPSREGGITSKDVYKEKPHKELDEISDVIEELDKADEEAPCLEEEEPKKGRKARKRAAPKKIEKASGEGGEAPKKDMESFQTWLRKLKHGDDD